MLLGPTICVLHSNLKFEDKSKLNSKYNCQAGFLLTLPTVVGASANINLSGRGFHRAFRCNYLTEFA